MKPAPTDTSGPTAQAHGAPAHGSLDTDPRTERARQAIEQAARELLYLGGPDSVTHAQVATVANVSRTTVYKHHPTRRDLIRAAIEVGKPFSDDLTGDLRTDLATLLGHLVDEFADDQAAQIFALFLERSQSDPELAAARNDMICQGVDRFTTIVTTAIDRGELCHDLDVDLAMAALCGSFMFRRFLTNEPVDHDVAARVIDLFIEQNAPR